MTDSEQNRSELPTQYKLTKARQKGSVARGMDLGFLTSLVAATAYLAIEGGAIAKQIALTARNALVAATSSTDSNQAVLAITREVLTSSLKPVAFLAATVFLVVLVFELAQTGAVFSTEPLRLDFGRLNPATGFKRVFSVRMLIETLKNVLKLAIYGGLTSFAILGALKASSGTIGGARDLLDHMTKSGVRLATLFIGGAVLFAAADQFIARRDYLKRMRMSRREVKRESRDREGEPRLKQRRKQLHREFTKASKSLRGVKGADVLITNPTHFAVALKYDPTRMSAPIVVSQGVEHLAQRLKRLAFLYGLLIIEDPPLARALYFGAQMDRQIPDSTFRRVASIYDIVHERKSQLSAGSNNV